MRDDRRLTFEIFESKGKHRFRARGGNGEIVLQSEGYSDRRSALDTIELLKSFAQGAPVEVVES